MSGAPEDLRQDLASDLWTNQPLRDDLQTAAVHRTYYLAGAAVATIASHQTSDDLLGARVRIAREVRDEATRSAKFPPLTNWKRPLMLVMRMIFQHISISRCGCLLMELEAS
ncbi:MAG: hypothetical protein H0X18_17875 [Geodermatophilaceae bacterium]|nr:hypothetical protein [Geodermatophilaceae bacterium]